MKKTAKARLKRALKNISKPSKIEQTTVEPAVPLEPLEKEEKKEEVIEEKEVEQQGVKRIKLPERITVPTTEKKDILVERRKVNEIYPLVSAKLGQEIVSLASANIRFSPQTHQLIYVAREPELHPKLEKLLDKTIKELHERLDIDFKKVKVKKEVYEYLNKQIREIWQSFNLRISPQDALITKYYIFRNSVGFGKIDAIMKDPNIEDISCDGIGLPIYIFHRNPIYGEIPTNIIFDTKEDLDPFVMKLAQKCNRTISVAKPLMDGSLPDGSRVQITYGTDIARRGSNFTIRKFFRVPLTPIDLINYGTVDALILAYLWLAIEKERSILISGTTATGKTTLLNVLSLFIEPNLKIVSIEDTAEIQLPQTNWMPQITRAGFGQGEYGGIEMYDLLRAALRQRPDYLIVGEVRGKEASVLFQAMSTGHPSLSTLHADTIEAVIDRLTTRPIDLPLALLENLDIIIFLEKTKKADKFTRRIGKIIEVEGYDSTNKKLRTNIVFDRIAKDDKFVAKESHMLHQIATRSGMNDQEIQEELLRKAHVLTWMKDNNITKFNTVAKLIMMYYINPKQLLDLMKTRPVKQQAPQQPQPGTKLKE